MENQVRVNLTKPAIERMRDIIKKEGIYESCEDFILHAVTDLLEQYK
jgi:Arc/MetJ-type ribon-helix-helix transcriptional regulator